jgi:hypothetical protein
MLPEMSSRSTSGAAPSAAACTGRPAATDSNAAAAMTHDLVDRGDLI